MSCIPLLLRGDQFAVVEPVTVWREQRDHQQQNQRRLIDVQVERQRAHERHVILKQSQTLLGVAQLLHLNSPTPFARYQAPMESARLVND